MEIETYYYSFYTVNIYITESEVSIIPENNLGKNVILNKKINEAKYIGDLYNSILLDREGIKTISLYDYKREMNKYICKERTARNREYCNICDKSCTNIKSHESCSRHKSNIVRFLEKMRLRSIELREQSIKRREFIKKYVTNN
jgi:hypothetical protein